MGIWLDNTHVDFQEVYTSHTSSSHLAAAHQMNLKDITDFFLLCLYK